MILEPKKTKSVTAPIHSQGSAGLCDLVQATLPTKVHLVKAMVFPVVIYGCESWTVKKAEY